MESAEGLLGPEPHARKLRSFLYEVQDEGVKTLSRRISWQASQGNSN